MNARSSEPFDRHSHTLRPLGDYRDRLPSRCHNRRLNRATLWRWALHGAGKERIKLPTVVIGSGRFTSDADVHAFIQARSAAKEAPETPPEPPVRREDVEQIQRDWQGEA